MTRARPTWSKNLLTTVPTTTEEALELFDASEAVDPDSMLGTWRGAELPTGHPMDGLLAASGWWGKRFEDAETVHPLLFPGPGPTSLWAFDPVKAFGGLGAVRALPMPKGLPLVGPIAVLRPILRTRSAAARLRTTRYRGVDTATMVYDRLPIHDVFRRLSDDTVIGAMDMRGSRRPYFFVLRRDDSRRLE
ncbi:DUF4334 domain-containing protein [Nocardiopsis lambiniae]|uniref:DUF4334 domain-containing protein n=1 Tax=Nocardiopsis lambiniae TaxID=3075539 RepID=A0ABU2M6W3_9ACTN|nr:DUF4334 domain-containing protein [Nocardiopsis sp. DSM 44743]MDT0328375.1 DUF4334 domain-containing protein [Nocardiopsis sp. DSM 44743]